MRLVSTLILALLTLLHGSAVMAAAAAGEVKYLRGSASAVRDGEARELATGDPVYGGEELTTRRRGLLVIEFRDGTDFTLGANSSMTVERFNYAGDGSEADDAEEAEEAGITTRVLRGTFRFVSGLIAKRRPSAMRVGVGAVATIGIRGTHVAGEVDASGGSAVVVLMEPVEDGAANAITVANEHGSVDIEEAGYGTEIPDADSPPTPPRRMRLRAIDNLMRSMQNIRRSSMPRPRAGFH